MRLIDADEFKAFLGEVRARYNLFSDEERPHYEAYSKALYIYLMSILKTHHHLTLYIVESANIGATPISVGEEEQSQ